MNLKQSFSNIAAWIDHDTTYKILHYLRLEELAKFDTSLSQHHLRYGLNHILKSFNFYIEEEIDVNDCHINKLEWIYKKRISLRKLYLSSEFTSSLLLQSLYKIKQIIQNRPTIQHLIINESSYNPQYHHDIIQFNALPLEKLMVSNIPLYLFHSILLCKQLNYLCLDGLHYDSASIPNESNLLQYFQHFGNHLKYLTVLKIFHIHLSNEIILILMQSLPSLSRFSLHDIGYDDMLNYSIPMKSNDLIELSIDGNYFIDEMFVRQFFIHCQQIRCLNIAHASMMSSVMYHIISKYCHHLTCFHLSESMISEQSMYSLLHSNSGLENLSIHMISNENDTHYDISLVIAKCCHQLSQLSLLCNMKESSLLKIIEENRNIHVLQIPRACFQSDHFNSLVIYCPLLKCLDIGHIAKGSWNDLKRFVMQCPNLKKLRYYDGQSVFLFHTRENIIHHFDSNGINKGIMP
jgi:hypothetical protein